MADGGAGGQGKVAQAIQQRIENGKFYEAQQMYRTQAFRFSGQAKYSEAKSMISEGSTTVSQQRVGREGRGGSGGGGEGCCRLRLSVSTLSARSAASRWFFACRG